MRPDQVTTLEAIDLANGQSFADSLAFGAKSMVAKKWTTTDDFVSYLFQIALTREPSTEEMLIAKNELGSSISEVAIQDLLWSICLMPEFFYVR